MQNSAIFRFSRFFIAAAAIIFSGRMAVAQTPNFPKMEGRPVIIPLSSSVTNGSITFSWPAMPGRWELADQEPAITGKWVPVPSDMYKTNGMTVSVTLPMPKQTAYFRVRQGPGFRPPAMPNLPPVPPPPTNRPPNFKPHA
jgi:hypothetical protein